MLESDDVLILKTLMTWKILVVYLLEQWPRSMQGKVTSLEPLTTSDISSSAWKAPSYVKHRAILMQRFPRVITNINALESEFLEYQTTPDVEFLAYFDEDNKLRRIDHIWHQIS